MPRAKRLLNDLELTAYHEAGHAAMCLWLGMTFDHMSIIGDEESVGRVVGRLRTRFRPDFTWDDGYLPFMQNSIQIALAGGEAERRMSGRYDAEGASSDLQLAYGLPRRAALRRSQRVGDPARACRRGQDVPRPALGHQACRRGYTAAFTKTSRLLADLAGGHADRTWGARLRRWARPDVLVLDDFAMRDFTAVQADDLYELITERQTRGSLVLTSNRSPV